MKQRVYYIVTVLVFIFNFNISAIAQNKNESGDEAYRPQIHFTPLNNWVNDPNGMVYYAGTYHLFYQYHPFSSVWGPMHWGHASSKDIIHWKREPIAIYPDSLGTIFSGSAVADIHNTSGFGKNGQVPLVAIFTQHDEKKLQDKRNDFQTQSIAYSLDSGRSWIKYNGNPVLKNPGINDFRDPKVSWYEVSEKWIMTLAVHDKISFYSSPDLKQWKKESDFGLDIGAHGGVWECPDLFPLESNGKTVWVLLVNLNPGAPNGGSGTQYFLGDFDGSTFTPYTTNTRWLEYGPDDYAGVTWSNTGKRKVMIGWMSNWMYANQVPTSSWRNGMTIPRELTIKYIGKEPFLSSAPVKEIASIQKHKKNIGQFYVNGKKDITPETGKLIAPFRLNFELEASKDFNIILSNDLGEQLVIGYDKAKNEYFIDRTKSGQVNFKEGFAGKHTAPRLSSQQRIAISLIVDRSSVELFTADGLSTMTELFFPNKPYSKIEVESKDKVQINKMEFILLKSIW
ncbi:MAG: glycoside hydrolase family 32 protein [Sphingobacteriales bacterium]|nr:glycoside hydrolase family 32 protein [Sphingobacteriales bacterium]